MDSALPAVPDLSNRLTGNQLNRQPGGSRASCILQCVEHVTVANRTCTRAMQPFLRKPEPTVEGKAPARCAIIGAAIRDIAVAAMSAHQKRHLWQACNVRAGLAGSAAK